MTFLHYGSASHGTMRDEDLIETFAALLADLDADDGAYSSLLEETAAWIKNDDALSSDLISDLFDALDSFAPEYWYFGAHEGDGSDYGFWFCSEQFQGDINDGNLASFGDLAAVPPGFPDQFAIISDHGNATLYAPTIAYEEVWSVV
jgi:hypothetical protein